ncbi:serine/threonine-protein kinase [Actinomycetospora lutea]|uniref:serine/threonine-protein kinase n=1 Tax=Actinomycetospora lutea TaxID=663604 RepID=UPI0023652C4F|nr:serine/threonine-protein kinase [Actinomycetospora lutea]MDD7939883.1 serine/threonine-protein kinase [Actinomycetospora lutea]
MTDVRPPLPASDAPGPLPDRLGERFELGELIGRGTCSEVFRAHDLLLDREAAVKIFPVADDPRIRREVRLMASMDHPSLVPVYDVGHDAGRAFVVMALLEGGSLADRLADGPLGVGETLLAVASVADGLSHVHRGGVLHRDVTPRNVLFDGDGRAHLSDFGVAFVADAPRITDTGIVVGSAPYLAPEQVRGETVGAPADVYALGLVMIEALTARPAFGGAPLEAARARLERRPEMPAGLEFEVVALLEAMTADDPAHRPTAENVCIGLRRAALAAETATPPYAMAPIVGAGTPDATTANLRPVAATAGDAARALDAETPLDLTAVPERRRRRRLADAGGFMVAASVAAAVLLAGGVVVASAWTVDRVNTATPPAATVPPPTAEVVADPGGGSVGGGGHSSSGSSSSSDDDGDRTRSSDDARSDRQAMAERAPSTAPVTDGGSASSAPPEPSSTTPRPTSSTTSPTGSSSSSPTPSSTSTSASRQPLLPGVPSLPTVPVPGGTTRTTPGATESERPTTSPATTSEATSEATTSEATTSEAATSDAATSEATSSAAGGTTTTTTTTAPRKVLGPAVEALGGVLGR